MANIDRTELTQHANRLLQTLYAPDSGTEFLPSFKTVVNPRVAAKMKADGVWDDAFFEVSPDLPRMINRQEPR